MTDIDLTQQHHVEFSCSAHNQAMDILYSTEQEPEDVLSLIELTHVAHWHWMQRADKTPQNVSVALWALSRAYSANGFADKALQYAKESLKTIEHENLLPSFYGYCNEALARAYLLSGKHTEAEKHYKKAMEFCEQIPTPQAKEWLLDQIYRIELINCG
jgi:tetratricopeptide (TPR) repeat protein